MLGATLLPIPSTQSASKNWHEPLCLQNQDDLRAGSEETQMKGDRGCSGGQFHERKAHTAQTKMPGPCTAIRSKTVAQGGESSYRAISEPALGPELEDTTYPTRLETRSSLCLAKIRVDDKEYFVAFSL